MNNRYDFKALGVDKKGNPPFIPPEALFIMHDDNGSECIEDMIDGYETLNVTGRELFAYNAAFTDVDGVNGSYLKNIQYPKRTITVKYMLNAKNDNEYREKFERLNEILSEKNLKFYFYDDPEYYYEGILTSAEVPEGGLDSITSTFVITCPYPFKRAIHEQRYTGTPSAKVLCPMHFAVPPTEINFAVSEATNHVEITNDMGQRISLDYDFKPETLYQIFPAADISNGDTTLIVDGEGSDIANMLELTSDFENFKVKQNTVVTLNPAGANSYITVVVHKEAL